MTVTVDVSHFYLQNIIDTCAIWNVLSSRLFYSRATSAKVAFYCTKFVRYECLYKARSKEKATDIELQTRLRQEIGKGAFQAYDLDLEDLEDVKVLERRKQLGMGELSSIVLARKVGHAFFTDDGNARKLAKTVMDSKMVQTTPHLLGWLYFIYSLSDGDSDTIFQEHKSLGGAFRKEHFDTMYYEALRCRLMAAN